MRYQTNGGSGIDPSTVVSHSSLPAVSGKSPKDVG